jgi:protein SCO1
MKRSTMILVLIAAFGLASGAYLYQRYAARAATDVVAALHTGLRYPTPRPIAPFALTADGQATLDLNALKGHHSLLFFGFTHCPDVCPLTLSVIAQALQQWPAELSARQPKVWFVSVDPDRDTLSKTREYVEFFNRDFGAATGNAGEIQAFTRDVGIVVVRTDGQDGAYSIDHSASLLVVDPDGAIVGLIRPPFEPLKLRDDLLALVSD